MALCGVTVLFVFSFLGKGSRIGRDRHSIVAFAGADGLRVWEVAESPTLHHSSTLRAKCSGFVVIRFAKDKGVLECTVQNNLYTSLVLHTLQQVSARVGLFLRSVHSIDLLRHDSTQLGPWWDYILIVWVGLCPLLPELRVGRGKEAVGASNLRAIAFDHLFANLGVVYHAADLMGT